MCMYVCTYIYIYIYIHTCIHIYIHVCYTRAKQACENDEISVGRTEVGSEVDKLAPKHVNSLNATIDIC